MGVAFDGYCYESATAAHLVAVSRVGHGQGAYVLADVTLTGGALDFDYVGAGGTTVSVSTPLDACTSVGPLSPAIGTGLNLADAAALSWGVVLCWVVVWGLAQLMRKGAPGA